MLIDEDLLVQRIEDILDDHDRLYLLAEWSETFYGVTIRRWGEDESLRYSVEIDDGQQSCLYLRGVPLASTWIECPHPDDRRGWWRLSSCGVEFLDGVLSACLDAVSSRQ